MLGRILTNTGKQIKRSGWVAWSSIAVMALAFFVATIFGGLAFFSNLYIQFIETRDNVLVFFEVGFDQEKIQELKAQWEVLPQIKMISFTSEDDAYNTYLAETEYTKPIEHELLLDYEEKKLNSSLDIQLYSLDDIPVIRERLVDDIETVLEEIDYDPEEIPILLRIDDQTLNEFREVFSFLRIGGAVILSLLFVIIFFFTLMTVEFRTFNRMEEIGVMQLVGGSLWYIRAPYILEGGFYGLVGAIISTVVIGGVAIAVFVANPSSSLSIFMRERLTILSLPQVTTFGWMAIVSAKLLLGFLLGGVSSYLAIKRYIK